MIISSIFLAISSSLDSLSIGITYGIKNMKISFTSKLILFIISSIIAFLSIAIGDLFNNIFSEFLTHFISSIILIFIGFSMIVKSIFEHINNRNNYYDFNYSNLIDPREAIALSLALSLDSFGIGISYSLANSDYFLFPFFISFFQIIFLGIGSFVGKKFKSLYNLPDFVCNIFSGVIIIIFGLLKL